MFRSLLVANRGEIACRIFRTARSMGLRCLAVHSAADAGARHVRAADASALLGPAPAAESYLSAERVLAAARALGADAIHPGYGFLSENPEFAEAVIAAGLVWVGPPPAAIRAMGLKDAAKRLAAAAGVPVLPGYAGEDQSEKRLLKAAREIGWPVLVKAVAGGGGRGIREAHDADALREALASARREAAAAFGDDRVLIEKLVARPRHIEVQVFGDAHGGLVHLYERDCSLQRRRQKVIEEAPAPGMTEEVRAAMTGAALTLARAVGYQNAGTVEFIVDGSGPLRADGFWFLEMNTRLQVEHPVTEAVTGLDLVEWQLRVAAGERLPLRQDQIPLRGHALEARLCAEVPAEGFRPSVGRLHLVHPPRDQRFDHGYDTGDTVPAAYDNLLGKLIASGEDRYDAIAAARAGLDRLLVIGVETNAAFLARILAEPDFVYAGAQTGDLETGFLAARHDRLAGGELAPAGVAASAVLLGGFLEAWRHRGDPWAADDGWRLNAPARPRIVGIVGERRFEADVRREAGGFLVALDSADRRADHRLTEAYPDGLELGDHTLVRAVRDAEGRVYTLLSLPVGRFVRDPDGALFPVDWPGARADLAGADAGDEIKAPLPGRIVALSTAPGAQVTRGSALVTLEAMKMEHQLKAPRDGVVAEVLVAPGAQVADGAVLVRLAAQE